MKNIYALRVNLLLIFGMVIFQLLFYSIALAQTSEKISKVTKPQIEAIQLEKASRSPAQQKLSSQLLDALKEDHTGVVLTNAPKLKAGPLTITTEGVLVDIRAKVTEDVLNEIILRGGRIVNKFPEYEAIRASMPLDSIESLAALSDVKQITPAVKARKNASFALEGVVAHSVDVARAKFSVFGAGVKIGVISDSIDNGYGALADSFKTDAMDSNLLTVLTGQEGDGEGEGLAMAEIIHAIAPAAQIIFATGYGGPAQMAANIVKLAANGCKIIVDDLTYFNESPFQDGPIGVAVNNVSDQGVLYFSSARNSGNKKHGTSGTWEGNFEDGGLAGPKFKTNGGRIHVFESAKRITLNTIEKATPDDRVDLFWSDPLGGSKNEFDLFVVNNNGEVVRSSTNSQNGGQDPYQSIDQIRPGQSIVIVKAGDSNPLFLHLDTGRAVLRYGTDGNVRGHNASGAANAFSVAAKRVPSTLVSFSANDQNTVEFFSSDGPRRVFFESNGIAITPGNFLAGGGRVLQKPDIAAANGVSTSLPKGGLNPFFGTSAAAPHAAAIAALLLSCTPTPSPSDIRQALTKSAIAIEGSEVNVLAGHGIVMAPDAVKDLCLVTTTAQKEWEQKDGIEK